MCSDVNMLYITIHKTYMCVYYLPIMFTHSTIQAFVTELLSLYGNLLPHQP